MTVKKNPKSYEKNHFFGAKKESYFLGKKKSLFLEKKRDLFSIKRALHRTRTTTTATAVAFGDAIVCTCVITLNEKNPILYVKRALDSRALYSIKKALHPIKRGQYGMERVYIT